MTITLFWLLVIIAVAVVLGRTRPILTVAVLFTVIGIYVGQTWTSLPVTAWMDHLPRLFT